MSCFCWSLWMSMSMGCGWCLSQSQWKSFRDRFLPCQSGQGVSVGQRFPKVFSGRVVEGVAVLQHRRHPEPRHDHMASFPAVKKIRDQHNHFNKLKKTKQQVLQSFSNFTSIRIARLCFFAEQANNTLKYPKKHFQLTIMNKNQQHTIAKSSDPWRPPCMSSIQLVTNSEVSNHNLKK